MMIFRNLNWNKRSQELNKILKWAKEIPSPMNYGAIISVSDGKDITLSF